MSDQGKLRGPCPRRYAVDEHALLEMSQVAVEDEVRKVWNGAIGAINAAVLESPMDAMLLEMLGKAHEQRKVLDELGVEGLAKALSERLSGDSGALQLKRWSRIGDLLVTTKVGPRAVIVVANVKDGVIRVIDSGDGMSSDQARWIANRMVEAAGLIDLERSDGTVSGF